MTTPSLVGSPNAEVERETFPAILRREQGRQGHSGDRWPEREGEINQRIQQTASKGIHTASAPRPANAEAAFKAAATNKHQMSTGERPADLLSLVAPAKIGR